MTGFRNCLAAGAALLTLAVSGGAVERTFEVPGYATVRVVAEGGAAEIEVTTGAGGETFAAVKGDGVCTSRCELVEFVPTGAYFGYGWYVAEPGDFTVCANGHHNSVRYAGFDLAGGRSLVIASSFTPMSLYHRAARKVAGYECHGPSTFAFYPGRDGAFACAIRARAFFDALGGGAPGVAAKSDKFCVDTWNGSLAEHGELIRRAADEYGLKDDLFLLVHCWQRYGFDRHLPEVWPPHPAFGTAADAKATLEIAKARGWLYGPHLNVIDVYSNSNWFAWNKVCHDANGRPIKAWINPYSLEQSFRLLHGLATDSIRYQFGQMESDGFRPSTAFVDVTGGAQQLTDITWDADGRVHPMAENVAANARMFDTLRESVARTYGNAAFVSSEAPSDYLAGHLDGGDCQWMCLGHSIDRVYCWTGVGGTGLITKVPWFPLVHHDRLILHGVGYSARFEGGRGELCHGIDSDDYISCEMMLGNEPMADCYNRDARDAEARIFRPLDMDRCLRQVVRKYWLEQPVSRELAMAWVKSAGFVDGNPEHVSVEWSTGLTVKVNRGDRDWTVDGHVLPQYGYRAWNPKTGTESKIYRHVCGRVVEESAYRDGTKTVRYASARGLPVPNFTPVEPRTDAVRTGARVKVTTDWAALAGERAPSGDWQVTYWLADPKFKESNPKSLMRRVATVVSPLAGRTEAAFDFPDDVRGRVSLLVSVSPVGADIEEPSVRLHLLGTAAFYRRFTQGFFGKDGAYETYDCPDRGLWDRLPAPKAPVDFGWTKTIDGVRVVSEPGKVRETKYLPGRKAPMAHEVSGMDVYEYAGEDYARLFAYGNWRVSLLKSGPIFRKATYQERHLETDETFVLLEGEATMVLGDERRRVALERGKVYNVRKGVWHQIETSADGKLLVVENDDTSRANSEYRPL